MITLQEAMEQRHSVREYENKQIEKELLDKIREEINAINEESGLHVQLVTDEPKAFDSFMAHYGNFSGVTNYIALVGKKGMEAALLAPTAMNQQKFVMEVEGNTVSAKAGMGFFANVDLGIVKYHFEVGAGKENFVWK